MSHEHDNSHDESEGEGAMPIVLKLDAQSAAPVRALFTPEHAPRLVKSQVIRHVRQLHARLAKAEAKAEAIVEEARARAEELREEAMQQAREEALAELHDTLAHARGEYDRLIRDAEQDIIALAMQVAQRIVHHRFEVEPHALKQMIEGALELVRDKRQITVHVHPDDLERVHSWRDELLRQVETTSLFFEANPDITPGDCLIDTEAGRVDARLSVQLDNFQRALTQS